MKNKIDHEGYMQDESLGSLAGSISRALDECAGLALMYTVLEDLASELYYEVSAEKHREVLALLRLFGSQRNELQRVLERATKQVEAVKPSNKHSTNDLPDRPGIPKQMTGAD